jgi:hypothetical protein
MLTPSSRRMPTAELLEPCSLPPISPYTHGRKFLVTQNFLYTAQVRCVLVSWVGRTDLRAPSESEAVGLGPIAQALEARNFDEVFLLSDYQETQVKPYVKWLSERSKARIQLVSEKAVGPDEFWRDLRSRSKGVPSRAW